MEIVCYNLNCLYFSYCETYDVVPIGYTKVGHFNIISAGNSLYYNMESLQTGGAIGLEYLKKDLTIGDRYCVDVVALNVDNMGGYLWIDGGVSGAERRAGDRARGHRAGHQRQPGGQTAPPHSLRQPHHPQAPSPAAVS